jgi:5-(carboxyamino)imidazole ribonucleotide synthase
MLGGGQLGRMFTMRAQAMGFRVIVLDPDTDSPAGHVANRHLSAAWEDHTALEELARLAAAATVEFENVPTAALEFLAARIPVRPSASALRAAQDRIEEKTALSRHGFDTAAWAPARTREELEQAVLEVGIPALLKTSRFGYDGKGQALVDGPEDAFAAFQRFGNRPCVLERRLTLERELSVVLARGADGDVACFPVGENVHVNGILDTTTLPAGISTEMADEAQRLASGVAAALDYVGVLGVELFVADGGQLYVNEIAPRPHNSGHWTLDVAQTSQFEQQVRAVCGLPLGDASMTKPGAAMVNLLGDLWDDGDPRWAAALDTGRTALHLYGKAAARPGRKMGHITSWDERREAAALMAIDARQRLTRRG